VKRNAFWLAVINTFYADNFICNCSVASQSFRDISALVTKQTVRLALTAKFP
jgi:hypothetical protein